MSVENLNKEPAGNRRNPRHVNRRNFLKDTLAAVAGITCGYSILASEVSAAQAVKTKKLVVRKPGAVIVPTNLKYTVKTPNYRVFKHQSQKKLVQSISHMLNQMAAEAGMKLNKAQISKLQNAFEQRGLIRVTGPGAAADVNVKVSGSLTLNW